MAGSHNAPDDIISIVETTIEGGVRAFPFFPAVIVTHRSLQSNFEDELVNHHGRRRECDKNLSHDRSSLTRIRRTPGALVETATCSICQAFARRLLDGTCRHGDGKAWVVYVKVTEVEFFKGEAVEKGGRCEHIAVGLDLYGI